ncbi:MAG: tetratricopeptide repeat protein [Plesiomonas sp.]
MSFDFEEHSLVDSFTWLGAQIFPDFSADSVQSELQQLRQQVQSVQHVALGLPRLLALIHTVYTECQFSGDYQTFYHSDNLRLDRVLQKRQGGPVMLGALLLHLGAELELPLYPVVFPTQFLLRAEFDDATLFINPFNGEIVNEHILTAWLKGHEGPFATLRDEDLDITEHSQVAMRLLDALKGALLHEKQGVLALKASTLLLEYNPDDPYEIRDRGLIFAALECNQAALDDLSYFVKQCPKDPVINLVREQIRSIPTPTLTLH